MMSRLAGLFFILSLLLGPSVGFMVAPDSGSHVNNKSVVLFAEPTNGEGVNGDNDREARYNKAMEEAKKMKVGELKKALTDRGISTKSFFEKIEFIKAYAEAIADNKTGRAGSRAGARQQQKRREEEPRDPSYRDVVMQKFDRRQLIGAMVIDTKAR